MDAPSRSDAAEPPSPAATTSLEDQVASLTLSHEQHNELPPSSKTLTSSSSTHISKHKARAEDIGYRNYANEDDLDVIIDLVAPYLSEPYSVYCYRYFLHGW